MDHDKDKARHRVCWSGADSVSTAPHRDFRTRDEANEFAQDCLQQAKYVWIRDAVLRNVKFQRLQDSVREERFPRIFDEIAQLIGASERAYAEATAGDYKDEEYLVDICHEETETIEELIGVAFLVLQMKITRVKTAASRVFAKDYDVLGLCGNHGRYQHSLITLIWEVANYYKHREAWPNAQRRRGSKIGKAAGQPHKRTLEVAKELGLLTSHSGNMAMAFEKLGITRPYSGCRSLAFDVQDWGEQVLRAARGAKPE